METKFNFKSQICTRRSQSERLLALGLKPETADMHWYKPAEFEHDYWFVGVGESWATSDIPAWSLHRLMSLVFNSGGTRVELFEDDDAYEILIYKIEMRIKKGYFNKEYLV